MTAADGLPNIQVDLQGVATNGNPLGVKGSCQAGAIAAAHTVMNAVMDALSALGVEHLDMPATPQRVWRAMEDARGVRNRSSACGEHCPEPVRFDVVLVAWLGDITSQSTPYFLNTSVARTPLTISSRTTFSA